MQASNIQLESSIYYVASNFNKQSLTPITAVPKKYISQGMCDKMEQQ